jgi:hypothetical protein
LQLNKNITTVPVDNYHIIKAEYQYSELGAKLTAFLPIPIKRNKCSHIEGAKEIVYNHQGVPSYYNDAFVAYYRTETKQYIPFNAKWSYNPIQPKNAAYTAPALQ